MVLLDSDAITPTSRTDDPEWVDPDLDDPFHDLLGNANIETAADDAETAAAVNWPASLTVYVKFGYENTLKAQMDADGTTFAAWIESVMTHVQTYFQHDTLPTDILFEVSEINYIFLYIVGKLIVAHT